MKNRVINACFQVVMGLSVIIGPHTIFQVCDNSEKVMKCGWSVRAEMIMGSLMIFSAVLFIFLKTREAQKVINIYNIVIGIAAILIPSKLIGGCANEMMACQRITFPAFYMISLLVVVFNIGNILYLKNRQGSE